MFPCSLHLTRFLSTTFKPQTHITMASAKSFALTALRTNFSRSSNITRQFHTSFAKVQPCQRAPRPAFVPVRWHSIPPSARVKDYDFSQIKEFASSPSPDRLIIGKPKLTPTTQPQTHSLTNTLHQTSASPPSTKQDSSPARSTSQSNPSPTPCSWTKPSSRTALASASLRWTRSWFSIAKRA
jgi:hypothetical protein